MTPAMKKMKPRMRRAKSSAHARLEFVATDEHRFTQKRDQLGKQEKRKHLSGSGYAKCALPVARGDQKRRECLPAVALAKAGWLTLNPRRGLPDRRACCHPR